jgi:type II secretion system protein J
MTTAHRPNGRGARRRGFTMIELIIALAMVAIVAASLSSSLWLAYHTARQAEAAVSPSRQAAIAMELMCSDLQNALQPGTILIGNFEATQAQDTRGHEGDDVVFYSTADSPQHVDANGDAKKVEYTTEQIAGTNDFVLVRKVTRNLITTVQPAPDEEIICRNVSSLTLQYFDGSTWTPTWDSTAEDNTIPAAVQITLEIELAPVNGRVQTVKYDRTVALSTSMAALDTAVNTGTSTP